MEVKHNLKSKEQDKPIQDRFETNSCHQVHKEVKDKWFV